MTKAYKQVSDERYRIIASRYSDFVSAMSDVHLNVVKVFDPLTKKQMDELELIREVSRDLQKKKEDDINKAAVSLSFEIILFISKTLKKNAILNILVKQ